MLKKLVMKFGGTSLMSTDRIKSAARIVASTFAAGTQVIVVVSAMGHETDRLLDQADSLSVQPSKRELDALMTTGEQVAAALMAIALQDLGCQARSFSGGAAGIITKATHGNAKIERIDTIPLRHCISDGCIPVVTGFQGITSKGEVTTLGRGGSDITAIALAAALNADRCDIYSDVDAVYNADPHVVPDAVRFETLSYVEMLDLSRKGAQVLNLRSVEIAKDKNVDVRVRSTFKPDDPGTFIGSSIQPMPRVSPLGKAMMIVSGEALNHGRSMVS